MSNDDLDKLETASSVFELESVHGGKFDGHGSAGSFDIAKKETKQVFFQRLVVLLVLSLAAAGICLVVFFITSNAETHEFEAHFEGGAEKIVSSFDSIVQQKLGAVGSLCLALTARGMTEDAANKSHGWPFVTMDSFQERAASARILSNVLHMSVLPLVTEDNREDWEAYSIRNGDWYAEGFAYQQALLENGFSLQGTDTRARALKELGMPPLSARDPRSARRLEEDANKTAAAEDTNTTAAAEDEFDLFVPYIYEYTEYWEIVPPPPEKAPFAPVWQSAPVTTLDGINLNIRSFPAGEESIGITSATGELALRGFMLASPGNTSSPDFTTAWYSELLSTHAGRPVPYKGDPISEATYPIFADFSGESKVVAVMNTQFAWQTYFEGLLPDNARGYMMVLENECDGAFSFLINGAEVEVLGAEDMHERQFSHMNISSYLQDGLTIHDGSRTGVKLNQRGCPYSLHVYPTQEMYDEYNTRMPLIITMCILFVFLFTAFTFFIYDRLVEKRQQLVVTTAKQSTDIVDSLFPEAIRDRLLQDDESSSFLSPNQRLKSFLSGGGSSEELGKAKPIADLFPHTTVMFADISGFTAWSSTRDPSQVFILLQTVYGAFDEIAQRREVFKVETIGDAYVAVAGLPNPQPTHAVIMTRFAWDCKRKLHLVLKDLEVSLGPDTNDLGMRFGLHSGAVTAGVLRGARARFQLFGDTVNTAARLESTGVPGLIHVSQTTANLLVEAGKEDWLESRHDSVVAKGKGVLNTFFVYPKKNGNRGILGRGANMSEPEKKAVKEARLIEWVTDLLLTRLQQIVVRRKTLQGGMFHVPSTGNNIVIGTNPDSIPLDEVVEHIKLPDFDYNAVSREDPTSVEIPKKVIDQLRDHVTAIAATYRNNPFHNFEHACHVAMSATKFLGRIVSPEIDLDALKGDNAHGAVASHLHDYTHGINSDPLTLFGIVYSALIHDCDHFGVGNAQTIKENAEMGAKYKGKSVAEQNSLDIAWNLLMADNLTDLRAYLFNNDKSEMQRLRQVVVNIVLATDIFDKELNDLRKKRWSKAFEESSEMLNDNLRGTIVLEHIIQASDVSHTMQHWHIYQKWNRRLFLELHSAYKQGRMGADPAAFWYKGEIGFFDNYIIPLAKKLKDCGVFGVSSDECLTYALQNRAEWEVRGQEIVQNLIQEVEGVKQTPVGKNDIEV